MGEENALIDYKEKEKVKVKSVAFALCSDDKETHRTPTSAQKASDDGVLKSTERLKDRDAALAQLELEKRLALIKAWEENEKAKADNKAHKKLSAIAAWENTKKASVEAQLKQIEEIFEKKKAEYGEKMKNKVAEVHREAEEKRAEVEVKRGEQMVKLEEDAAKFRSTGYVPTRFLGCFSCGLGTELV
ncbi:remorin-like [Ipomoea triloba]|uniref:remorin-like n=1 Tax=Ipomoea triloba TaxID=35885 RepID=UPI00125D3881|nr:remorin-like [Ipomoea triloba]